jgi:ABC-type cobalamin/Fe3+-siderophores transport system ATPase subunit
MSTIIKSLRTTAGFLEKSGVEFAPGLTCVIGARGTCKSTLVEMVRFAFHCNADKVELLTDDVTRRGAATDAQPSRGLVRATLGTGRVCCAVEDRGPAGTFQVTVEREVGAAPQVYREGVRELSESQVLQRVEIYSQGDLQLIAQDDPRRLDLVDRPHKARVDALKDQRDRHMAALSDLGPKIRAKRIEIEAKRAELLGLGALRTQLAELQRQRPTLSEELDRERGAYLQRTDFVQRLDAALKARSATVEAVLAALPSVDGVQAVLDELARVGTPEADALAEVLTRHREFVTSTRALLQEATGTDPASLQEAVRDHLEGKNARYYELRRDQQEVNDSLKREDTLKREITHLERLQADVERLESEVAELMRKRQESREDVRRVGDEIYTLRAQEVDTINRRHSDVVILTLEQGVRSPGYAEKLVALLKGSNLRSQPEVVRDLGEKVRPSDLVDIVERSDAQRLSGLLNRDLGQMTRLVGHLNDQPGLYDLDAVVFEDRLEITMYDDGVLKPVGQLSKGQMATALLPLILRSADYPLIFDQPEDDLDNRFVYKTLVEIVRKLKLERQLIFVTHNANIPVLGEADRVIVMRMETPLKAAAPICGSVDEVKEHILNLLEGGREAFQLRQQKYQALLSS